MYFGCLKTFFSKINFNIRSENQYINSFNLCLISISTNFWPLAPTGNFFNNWINMIIYFPLGILIYNYIQLTKKNK